MKDEKATPTALNKETPDSGQEPAADIKANQKIEDEKAANRTSYDQYWRSADHSSNKHDESLSSLTGQQDSAYALSLPAGIKNDIALGRSGPPKQRTTTSGGVVSVGAHAVQPMPDAPATTLRRHQGAAIPNQRPGAFPSAPGVVDTSDSHDVSSQEGHMDPETLTPVQDSNTTAADNNDATSGLAVAQAVDPTPNRDNLPQARPEEEKKQLSQEAQVVMGVCFFAVIGAIAAGVAIALTQKDQLTLAPSTPPSLSPSMAPTTQSEPLRNQILNVILPGTTRQAIDGDPSSAQARALEWILQDPLLEDYLEGPRFFQRFALATFFYATNGTAWSYNENWLSYDHHECHWFGRDKLAFDQPEHLDGQITYLADYDELVNRNACELPPNTTFDNTDHDGSGVYRHLWLTINNLDGTLPPQVFWLTQLRSMSLYGNYNLRGTIPSQVGLVSGLENLAIAYAGMTGTMPTQLGLLTRMHFLGIPANRVNGTVPSQLGRMSGALTQLFLDNNHLTGSIPEQLYDNTLLKTVYFYHNQMTGTVSTRIGLLSNLWDFSISNQLHSGTVPSQIGLQTLLKRIIFYNNQFTGTICTELGLLSTKLEDLELNVNQLTGTVPSELAQLDKLSHLLLQRNELSGVIPPEIADLWSQYISVNITRNDNLVAESLEGVPLDSCRVNVSWFEKPDCSMSAGLPGSCQCDCCCNCPAGDDLLLAP